MTLGNQLGFGPAQAVTTPDGMVRFIVMKQDEDLPMSFVYWALRAPHRVILRMAGGTSIPEDANKRALIELFDTVARRRTFEGVFMSGGTRLVDAAGKVDPMIVEVPSVFKRHNPRMIALGTAPRTAAYMTYRGAHSSFFMNDDPATNTLVNPDLDCLMIVQLDASGVLEWDGDVDIYFNMMKYLRDNAGFTAAGTITWNGGGVTAGEVRQSLERGFPTLVVGGSGRVADGLVVCRNILLEGGSVDDFPEANRTQLSWLTAEAAFDVVSHDDPDGLEAWLTLNGFLRPSL